jgi:hypothetical protein
LRPVHSAIGNNPPAALLNRTVAPNQIERKEVELCGFE